MGKHEPGLVHHGISPEQEVEVDRPRPPALGANTAEPTFDVEKQVEQRPRVERRLELRDAVQERGLLDGPPRLRLAKRGDPRDGDPRRGPEQADGSPERLLPIAEVRAQPHVRAHQPEATWSLPFLNYRVDVLHIAERDNRTSMIVQRVVVVVLAAASIAAGGTASGPARAAAAGEVVQLKVARTRGGGALLARAGATQIDSQLRLWSVPARAGDVLPLLRSRDMIATEQPERIYEIDRATLTPDPLELDEWWRAQIGIDGLTPPGPGIPVTIVDTGLDLAHPEFADRPDTVALNAQEPPGIGGNHGTSVASVIGAPVNGVGTVGIYPQALLRSWDIALGAGTTLDSGQIAAGILAAARAGRGVINLSVGGSRDLAIELAVDEAVAMGSLVVAASGNDGETGSRPISYPGALPHVITVAATDRSGRVTSFSSQSPYVDLAAPGVRIPVAIAEGQNWDAEDGTSFSSPIVAGAAAWIWTARPELTASQVAEILRRSARDIGQPGRDPASGFGMLDVGAALALPAPVRDPFEPNDDIDQVDPASGNDHSKAPPLTTRSKRHSRIAGRVDEWEDPHDVFRVWLPARAWVTATLRADANAIVSLYSSTARTVESRFGSTGRLAQAHASGTLQRLVYRNAGPGRWAYVAVALPPTTVSATYNLAFAASTRKPKPTTGR